MNYFKSASLSIVLFLNYVNAQTPPSDFKLVGTTGGTAPWDATETITILSNGQVNFFRFQGGDATQILLDTNFIISASQVQQIWQSIQNSDFFSLNSNYQDDTLLNGSFVLFTVFANSSAKQVKVKNIKQEEIENIIATINSNVPENFKLIYKKSEKINIVPIDPCGESLGSVPFLLKGDLLQNISEKAESNYSIASVKEDIRLPHGGVAIGYEMSLFEAVETGRVSLKSKGRFFGDAVSISGDNTKNFPPQKDTITIKLYMEFYGPCADETNVAKIVGDILAKWDGLTTSNGKTVRMDVVSLLSPVVETPPATPGYENIYVECGTGRSYCFGLGTPNSDGVTGGKWVSETGDGVYAHEAGHLMGLPNRYTEYTKQPDGTWLEKGASTQYSPDDFLTLFRWHYPDYGLWQAQKILSETQFMTFPLPDHENDLMASRKKPPLQSDIDALAAQAGLIININVGDVLASLVDNLQNLLIIHPEDLVLKPGEIKTLNGIYSACLDLHRSTPNLAVVYNAAPSLEKWNGIYAAADLLKLAKYIDSEGYYCGGNLTPQYAIWRITDNYLTGSEDVNSLFDGAGINTDNLIYNFPKLTNNSTLDTISKVVVPNELFFPDIQPEVIQAEIGENLVFNGSIYKPSGFNYTTSFSWLLDSPEGSSSQISNGSFIPDIKGVYNVSLKIDITDPDNNITEYYPEFVAYVLIPDEFTETFEHANLNRFHWETYGDSKWEVTNSDAQTGSYSVKPGEITEDQSTALAINVNLPEGGLIAFAVKSLTRYGTLNFYVDSVITDYWNELMDWTFFEYGIDPGEHRLTWEFKNYFDKPSTVWVDNIFFPANSVVVNIDEEKQAPLAFNLFQNYPNPYNPATEIKYSLAEQSRVKILIYDLLGRKIMDLLIGEQNGGTHKISFDGSNLSSGIYFYGIEAGYSKGIYKDVKKMILLK